MGGTSTRALTLAAVLVLSLFAPAAAAATTAPDGMVGVPDGNISEDLPADASTSLDAGDLRGAVAASDHADSLEVIVTTPDRAQSYLDSSNANAVGSGDTALVLRDDSAHDGREVALPARALREAFGYLPERVYGVHDSGDEWSRATRVEDGSLVFEVPRFSSNVVTWSGGIDLGGSSATDGTTYQYDLVDLDSASDPLVNITGVLNEETETVSRSLVSGTADPGITGTETPPSTTLTMTGNGFGRRTDSVSAADVGDGHSSSIDVEGSLSDTSQAADPTVTVTGREMTESESESGTGNGQVSIGGTESVGGTLSVDKSPSQHYSTTSPDSEESHTVEQSNLPEFVTSVEVLVYASMSQDSDGNTAISDGGDQVASKSYDTPSQYDSKWVEVPVNHQFTGNLSITESYGWGRMHLQEVIVNGHSSTTSVSVGQHSTTLDITTAGGQATWDVPSLSPGNYDVTADSDVSWTFDHTEHSVTTDPSVSLNGNTKTYQGTLADGETATLSWSPTVVDAGSTNSIGLSLPSSSLSADAPPMRADYAAEVEEVDGALSPSVDVDGDGSAEVSHSGLLTDGETESTSYQPEVGQTWSVDGSGSPVTVSAEITERTLPSDVGITLNGQTELIDGVIGDGETVSRTLPKEWLREGVNQVNVSIGDGSLSSDAPVPKVGFEYRHEAMSDVSADVSAEKWTIRANASKTFASDRDDGSLTVPFGGDVVNVREVEVTRDGTTVDRSWSFDEGDLEVDLGSIDAGTEYGVRAVASRVHVVNGSITVLEPTTQGNVLDTQIRLDEWSADSSIDVTGISSDRTHYVSGASWADPQAYVELGADGSERLRLPGASTGSTTSVRTLPLKVEPMAGTVEVAVTDPNEPRFRIRPGSENVGDVSIEWRDVKAGETYQLIAVTQQDTPYGSDGSSDGAASFRTDADNRVYTFQIKEDGSGAAIGGVGGSEGVDAGSWDPLTILATFGGLTGSILATLWLGRKLGASGARQHLLLLVVGSIVGTVGAEAVTSQSIIASITYALGDAAGGVADSGVGAVVIGSAFLLLVWYVYRRWSWVPRTGVLLAVGATALWVLDSLFPGALDEGLSTVSPLLWVLGGIAVIIIIYLTLRGRPVIISDDS